MLTAVRIISVQSHLPRGVVGPLFLEVPPLRFGGLVPVFGQPGVAFFCAGVNRGNSVCRVKQQMGLSNRNCFLSLKVHYMKLL